MPLHLLSQLAHVELLTPRPQESLDFFHELLGFEVSARDGQSVYLRAWGDLFHHSIKLTEAAQPGLGHASWRSDGEAALMESVALLERLGAGEGWNDGDLGHGTAYEFRLPDGHLMEVLWDVEWHAAPAGQVSPIRNHPQKISLRGASVRRLDHVTVFASEVAPNREFLQQLGFRHHEDIFADGSDEEIACWMAVTNLSHDTSVIRDPTGAHGRLNHTAFRLDAREDVLRAADIMRDNDIFIEAGPSKHGVSEGFFLYVHEPGGNRIELYSGGYLNFAPDWGPIKWYASENPGTYWGGGLPASIFSYGTPPASVEEQTSAAT